MDDQIEQIPSEVCLVTPSIRSGMTFLHLYHPYTTATRLNLCKTNKQTALLEKSRHPLLSPMSPIFTLV